MKVTEFELDVVNWIQGAMEAANPKTPKSMNGAVADSTDLQEKVKAGADLVALGKDNGYEFTQEELEAGWEELESDEGLTEFELDVVAGWSPSEASHPKNQ